MKTNKKILKVKNDQGCSYRVTIPLNIKDNVDKNTVLNYNISVYENGKVIEVERNSDTFYFERTDPLGIYFFKVQLKNENNIIEEQKLEINIKEEFHIDILSEEETNIEIDDKNLLLFVKEKLNDIELIFYSYPTVQDKNSAVIFKEFKKIKRDNDIVQVLCKILSDESDNLILLWKTITILEYYSADEALVFIKSFAERTFENKTQYLHFKCVKYLDAVNTLKNRETVVDTLIYFASECITPEGRTAAISSLVKTGRRNDQRVVQCLFKIIEEDINHTAKITAIQGLSNFNINDYSKEVEVLLQDPSQQVRYNTCKVLHNSSLKLQFNFLKEIFEGETDNSTRTTLSNLMFQNYLNDAKEYFPEVLEWGDEDYTNTILNSLKYSNENMDFVKDKFEYIKENDSFSNKTKKEIEAFLKKFEK